MEDFLKGLNMEIKEEKEMVDILKDYWELALTVILGSIWMGRLSQRVSSIEKENEGGEPAMTVLACGKQTIQCQAYNTREFHEIKELIKTVTEGNQEFIKEVNKSNKQLIRDSNLRSDEQHKLVMTHLLSGNGNTPKNQPTTG